MLDLKLQNNFSLIDKRNTIKRVCCGQDEQQMWPVAFFPFITLFYWYTIDLLVRAQNRSEGNQNKA